ncbi:MAG TPA: PAS domain-containing protein [Alphaproteobacteria bacterium]|nr:PAS domain-containing protein [Alphaproteobacteria bacterium]
MPLIQDAFELSSPRLRQAYAYWDGKRLGRRMPARRDLDPLDIPTLLPNVMLLDVLSDPLDFRYRLIGTEVRSRFHRDYTGVRLSELPDKGRGSIVWQNSEQVVISKAPFSRMPPYVGPDEYVRGGENLLLPLSDDDETVNMIFQVIEFERSPPL